MSTQAVEVRRDLLDVAQRLALEYNEFAAGAVLRAFARSVAQLRRRGHPAGQLTLEAEAVTRQLLSQRAFGRSWGPVTAEDLATPTGAHPTGHPTHRGGEELFLVTHEDSPAGVAARPRGLPKRSGRPEPRCTR